MSSTSTIFDIDHSKISFSAAKTGTAANGQPYEYHEALYNRSSAVRFTTPVVKFELVDNNKGKPAISMSCDDPKLFEATDFTLKLIKEKCLTYRGADVPAKLNGVYEGATGRKSAYLQIFLDGKFGSTPCEIPSVDENGVVIRSRTGVPQFSRIDIKSLSGKLCEGIIEFKLGRCTMPPTRILTHKFQVTKVICFKFVDRPINSEANNYLASMSEDGVLDLQDMHNQLVVQGDTPLESKSDDMPEMSELDQMNLVESVVNGVAFAESDSDSSVPQHSFQMPSHSPAHTPPQQQSFQMPYQTPQQQSFQMPSQTPQKQSFQMPSQTPQQQSFQMPQQQSFQMSSSSRPNFPTSGFTVDEAAYK